MDDEKGNEMIYNYFYQ